jgi:GDP-4-dehydro-6-deoxy-D-mannose reductase
VRVLVTGASGFAGSHLVRACVADGDEVVALGRNLPPEHDRPAATFVSLDLRDGDGLIAVTREAEPEVVYHLAALSSVGRSWEAPQETLAQNTVTSVNVLEAVRRAAPSARVVWVSSCEVYGPPAQLPVGEDAPMAPANPYAVSKAAGEQLAVVYAEAYGLDLVRARPFSHGGPGQLPIFIMSSLARQGAEARAKGAERVKIVTGNPHTRRDFTDVRDVARAYRLLAAERGATGVFNVCSGQSVAAADQVAILSELLAPIEVDHVVDPARVRAHEVMDLRGSHDRLTAATGWKPSIPFRQTMADTLAWWESQLASSASADASGARA